MGNSPAKTAVAEARYVPDRGGSPPDSPVHVRPAPVKPAFLITAASDASTTPSATPSTSPSPNPTSHPAPHSRHLHVQSQPHLAAPSASSLLSPASPSAEPFSPSPAPKSPSLIPSSTTRQGSSNKLPHSVLKSKKAHASPLPGSLEDESRSGSESESASESDDSSASEDDDDDISDLEMEKDDGDPDLITPVKKRAPAPGSFPARRTQSLFSPTAGLFIPSDEPTNQAAAAVSAAAAAVVAAASAASPTQSPAQPASALSPAKPLEGLPRRAGSLAPIGTQSVRVVRAKGGLKSPERPISAKVERDDDSGVPADKVKDLKSIPTLDGDQDREKEKEKEKKEKKSKKDKEKKKDKKSKKDKKDKKHSSSKASKTPLLGANSPSAAEPFTNLSLANEKDKDKRASSGPSDGFATDDAAHKYKDKGHDRARRGSVMSTKSPSKHHHRTNSKSQSKSKHGESKSRVNELNSQRNYERRALLSERKLKKSKRSIERRKSEVESGILNGDVTNALAASPHHEIEVREDPDVVKPFKTNNLIDFDQEDEKADAASSPTGAAEAAEAKKLAKKKKEAEKAAIERRAAILAQAAQFPQPRYRTVTNQWASYLDKYHTDHLLNANSSTVADIWAHYNVDLDNTMSENELRAFSKDLVLRCLRNYAEQYLLEFPHCEMNQMESAVHEEKPYILPGKQHKKMEDSIEGMMEFVNNTVDVNKDGTLTYMEVNFKFPKIMKRLFGHGTSKKKKGKKKGNGENGGCSIM